MTLGFTMRSNLKVFVLFCVPVFVLSENSKCPKIINRAKWGAQPPRSAKRLPTDPLQFVVVHHSYTPTCTTYTGCKTRIKNIQQYHMKTRGWSDIGYNFLIGSEGTIYEGRGWGVTGAHAKGWNSRSFGICLIGQFKDNNPSAAQLMALENLIACGVGQKKIHTNYSLIGHRQAGKTECPGDKMYSILKNMLNYNPNPR